jgi:predicted permease
MNGLIARMRSFWRGVRHAERLSAEMEEEMRFHIELEAERLARERGLDPGEARRRAAAAFGGVEKHKEAGRDARGVTWVSGLSLDLKLAWRMLRKFPGLTVVGVLGIALGIAVGVGSFVLLSSMFFPELPLEEGDRIVALENWDAEANREARRSLHDFAAWRQELRTVEQVAAVSVGSRPLVTGTAPPQPARVAEMTAAGFQVARVPPLLGRYLVPDDEREGAPRVAVIGYGLWRARLGGDPGVIGRRVLVGELEHVVVGVMPPGFAFPRNEELWTPLRDSPARHARGEGPELFVFGRLAPGATREQAQAELTALGRRAAAASPATHARLRPRVLPYTYPLTNTRALQISEIAQIELMVNLLLLGIAVNIAVLVYARTAMRRAEIAVRTALGASRRRIVGQLFVEALLLSLIGAGLGLAIAHAALRQMEAVFDPEGTAFWVDHGLQPRSAAFALVLAALSAVVVGVLPGLKSTGRGLEADLRRLGGGTSVRLGRAWTALIVVQVAVAVAILPTAVSFGYREIRMGAVLSTFPAHEFLSAGLGVAVPLRPGMDADAYRRETSTRLADRLPELERRLEAEPAVAGVTFEGSLPGRTRLVEVEDRPGPAALGAHPVLSTGVAADYFEVMDARVLAGRGFGAAETELVVSEGFVRRVIGAGEAVGRRIRFVPQPEAGREAGAPGPWMEIAGVVEDLYASRLDPAIAPPAVYYPVAPGQLQSANLLVRVRGGDAAGFAPGLRRITTALDPDLRLGSVETLATLRNGRYLAMAVSGLTLVLGTVLLLSAAGIHALMSLTVTRRRKEVGIRTALGARPGRLLAGIFSRAAWQLALGGLAGSVLGGGLLLLNGLTSREAAVFLGGIILLMLTVGLAAAAGPARRGLRIQPMEALKEE